MPAPITRKDYNNYLKLGSFNSSNRPMPFEKFVEAMNAESERDVHSYTLVRPKQETVVINRDTSLTVGVTPAAKEYIKSIRSPLITSTETPIERYDRYKRAWWSQLCEKVGKPILTDNQKRAIAYIIAWFARLEFVEFNGSTLTIDLYKGLWIAGDSGVGKTTTIEILQKVTGAFALVSMHALAIECLNAGDLTPITSRIKDKIYCIDDVGAERKVKIFGNDVEPFSELVMLYEKQSRQNGLPLIATSNILPMSSDGTINPAFQDRYGERQTNRVLHLFTVVYMDGETQWY